MAIVQDNCITNVIIQIRVIETVAMTGKAGTISPDWKRRLIIRARNTKRNQQDCSNCRSVTPIGIVLSQLLPLVFMTTCWKGRRDLRSEFTRKKSQINWIPTFLYTCTMLQYRQFRQDVLILAHVNIKLTCIAKWSGLRDIPWYLFACRLPPAHCSHTEWLK